MKEGWFPAAVAAYLLIGFTWPTWRVWRRWRVWPVVFARDAAPGQRLLGRLSGALSVAVVTLSVLHAWLGPQALGGWPAPAAAGVAGWTLMAAGTLLTVLAQWQMGASWRVGIDERPTGLVTAGLFGVVRNPIFTGLLVFLAGFALRAPAWWSAALWLATVVGLRVQVGLEEAHLLRLHGATYRDYAARTGRFLPLVGRLDRGSAPGADPPTHAGALS